jgi:soluble lytic murein transglycosylase-like protein
MTEKKLLRIGRLFRALTISIFLISFFSCPAVALTKITTKQLKTVYAIGAREGVPASIVRALMAEESGGYVDAVSHETAEGYVSRGLFQLYDKPGNLEWLLARFWPGGAFDINDPVDNATVALAYLAALHARFGNWYQALVYYNFGDIKAYPQSTRNYAKRIINAP